MQNFNFSSKSWIVIVKYNEIVINNEIVNELATYSAKIYFFKVNNKSIRKWCYICSNLIITTPERHCYSGRSIVNFEYFTTSSSVSIVDFEQLNVCWA